jgi:cytochrome c oxidase cbb3-type subunit III
VKNRWDVRCVLLGLGILFTVCIVLAQAPGQEKPTPKSGDDNPPVVASPAAVRISRQDPAAVKRGGAIFAAGCASCHGAAAKGTDRGADLVGSKLVEDDEAGNLIGPVLRTGHPKGMAKPDLTDAQISDLVAWLRAQIYGAAFRQTYTFLNVLVGDPKKGMVYFSQKCAGCHSATGDMAGIGAKYDPPALQLFWLTGGGGGRAGRSGTFASNGSMTLDTSPPHITKSTTTITVTLASGQTYTGIPLSVTDFNVAFKDMSGVYHSYSRDGEFPKVETHNPLQVHSDMVKTLQDDDMRNMTAYLVTLK